MRFSQTLGSCVFRPKILAVLMQTGDKETKAEPSLLSAIHFLLRISTAVTGDTYFLPL